MQYGRTDVSTVCGLEGFSAQGPWGRGGFNVLSSLPPTLSKMGIPGHIRGGTPPLGMRIRQHVRDSDWPMIKDNWKKSYRHALYYLDDATYFSVLGKRIDDLRDKARWAIAVDPEDDEFIFGWACFGVNAVHYVYVRRVYRGAGVAQALVQPGPWVPCTHWTRTAEKYAVEHPGRLCYTPGRLEYEKIGVLNEDSRSDTVRSPEATEVGHPVRGA